MNKVLILALLLSGCATAGVWNHPNKTQEQFTADKYECLKDGEEYAANISANGNPYLIMQRAKECMAMKGYVWAKTTKPT